MLDDHGLAHQEDRDQEPQGEPVHQAQLVRVIGTAQREQDGQHQHARQMGERAGKSAVRTVRDTVRHFTFPCWPAAAGRSYARFTATAGAGRGAS